MVGVTVSNVHCECGEALGTRCEWSGPKSETTLVEWMPDHLRASHCAAHNSGVYPHNGAIRIRCERTCAELIIESDPEWATTVEFPKP